jgi:uncharacterized ParB-like nuclease family protein
MLRRERFPIAQIYVPAKRRGTANPDVVREIAESMLEVGQQTPVLVRRDGDRLILVEGLHRLEACKALGEETIVGFLVQARVGPQKMIPAHEAGAEAARQKMARLRQLRLAKEAAPRSSAIPATPTEQATKNETGKRSSRSNRAFPLPKRVTFLEWLAERERDGVRR